jgi:hypothetical protein
LGGVDTFRVVACVQEAAVTADELLADADLIHYTMGASERDEEEQAKPNAEMLKAETGARGQDRARREARAPASAHERFRDWELGPAKAHYL